VRPSSASGQAGSIAAAATAGSGHAISRPTVDAGTGWAMAVGIGSVAAEAAMGMASVDGFAGAGGTLGLAGSGAGAPAGPAAAAGEPWLRS
jgi:hypothetical protein